jgi:hypothetical protein
MACEKEVERFGYDTVERRECGTCGRQTTVALVLDGGALGRGVSNCADCLVDLANIVAFAVVP